MARRKKKVSKKVATSSVEEVANNEDKQSSDLEASKDQKVDQPDFDESRIEYYRLQNVSNKTMRIHGSTLRPNELSKSFTSEQIKAMRVHLKPLLNAGVLKEISA